jgi:hypothetical protein
LTAFGDLPTLPFVRIARAASKRYLESRLAFPAGQEQPTRFADIFDEKGCTDGIKGKRDAQNDQKNEDELRSRDAE